MDPSKIVTVRWGLIDLMYYPEHDKRYAHIPAEERWKYPDAVRTGGTTIKREKNLDDIKMGEVPRFIETLLLAKDIPITEACVRA